MKVYCRNCINENSKICGTTIKVHSKHFGLVLHSVRGCGKENIVFKEDENGYSFIPKRNVNNNCEWYKKKWWKFWIKGKEGR